MFRFLACLVLSVLGSLAIPGIASPAVYTVAVSDGTETITGSIATDGRVGAINANDISAWDFVASGPVSTSADSNDPGSSVECGVTCISASESGLSFDFTASGSTFSLDEFAHGRWDLLASPPQRFMDVVDFSKGSATGYTFQQPAVDQFRFATASVPEPGTLVLLALGLVTGCARALRVRCLAVDAPLGGPARDWK